MFSKYKVVFGITTKTRFHAKRQVRISDALIAAEVKISYICRSRMKGPSIDGYVVLWVLELIIFSFELRSGMIFSPSMDLHRSQSDDKLHWTVDVYQKDENELDKPVGCVHVYDDYTLRAFEKPRTKAKQVIVLPSFWLQGFNSCLT